MKENTACDLKKLFLNAPYMDSLLQAKLQCLRTSNCSSVLGTNGKYFEHTRFKLCGGENDEKAEHYTADNKRYGNIPPGIYVKPGIY